ENLLLEPGKGIPARDIGKSSVAHQESSQRRGSRRRGAAKKGYCTGSGKDTKDAKDNKDFKDKKAFVSRGPWRPYSSVFVFLALPSVGLGQSCDEAL
ncbi:MAG TPA: hypothetical protein VLT87_30035, partial [Thermoanaerobaculia bacterium]|nr:hypothetical protein [Thermoanaerobaculia bacterium]